MANERLSPGVYSSITDLSTYVEEVPSTIAFIPFVANKGRDNEMIFFGSRDRFIKEYGTCDYEKFGAYAEGLFTADNFIKNSPSLYAMRVLPDDATYANLSLVYDKPSHSFKFEHIVMKDEDDMDINFFDNDVDRFPIVVFYPVGRGEYYNDLKIRFSLIENDPDVYILDIYEKNSSGDYDIVETFNVSFRRDIKDFDGDNLFIEEVLNKFSEVLRCKVNEKYTYNQLEALIRQDILNNATNIVSVKDIIGENGTPEGAAEADRFFVSASVVGEHFDNMDKILRYVESTDSFVVDDTITLNYNDYIRTDSGELYLYLGGGFVDRFNPYVTPFLGNLVPNTPPDLQMQFGGGSDGSFFDNNGRLVDNSVNQALIKAYTGLLDSNVIDRDNYYFSIVYDCGYPKQVKDAAVELARILRRDCVAILSNGKDSKSANDDIKIRRTLHTYNTYFASLYSGGTKVYNEFEGRSVKVHPTYHMAYVIPYNDRVANQYHAPAGLNRAMLDDVEFLMYNPIQGDQERLYMDQINPIVKFSDGYAVWGQQTTQRKPSALQSLNIVRTVLYIDTALRRYCRFFNFEQNDSITWNQVQREVDIFLEEVKNERGLYEYSTEVSATEYELKRKTFHVNVQLTPTRSAERIMLNFFIS